MGKRGLYFMTQNSDRCQAFTNMTGLMKSGIPKNVWNSWLDEELFASLDRLFSVVLLLLLLLLLYHGSILHLLLFFSFSSFSPSSAHAMIRQLSGFFHSLRNACARNNVAHLALFTHYLSLLDLRHKMFTNTSVGFALSHIPVLPPCEVLSLNSTRQTERQSGKVSGVSWPSS